MCVLPWRSEEGVGSSGTWNLILTVPLKFMAPGFTMREMLHEMNIIFILLGSGKRNNIYDVKNHELKKFFSNKIKIIQT